MHLSGVPRRRSVAPFSNHTPRPFEVQGSGAARPSSKMFGPAGITADPASVRTPAQQVSSAQTASVTSSSAPSSGRWSDLIDVHKDTAAALRDGSPPSDLSGSPIHAPGQEPFLDKMMTQTNLLILPPSNPSYQMAYFLKTTGPVEGKATKPMKPKRISSAMRLFKQNSHRHPPEGLAAAHNKLNSVISSGSEKTGATSSSDSRLPDVVVQKVSSAGTKYFQIEPKDIPPPSDPAENAPVLSADIIESQAPMFVTENTGAENLENWIMHLEDSPEEQVQSRPVSETVTGDEETIRIREASPNARSTYSLIPKISTPIPNHVGQSIGETLEDGHSKAAPLRSNPVLPDTPPMPAPLVLTHRAASQHHPAKNPHLVHPKPRRVGSHPVLLNRGSTDVTGLQWSQNRASDSQRSVPDSPGPPPARSPLRLQTNLPPMDTFFSESRVNGIGKVEPVELHCPSEEVKLTANVLEESELTALPAFIKTPQESDMDLSTLSKFPAAAAVQTYGSPVKTRTKQNRKALKLIDSIVKPAQPETPRRRLRRNKPEGPRPIYVSTDGSQSCAPYTSGSSCAGSVATNKRSSPFASLSENARMSRTIPASSSKAIYPRKPAISFMRGMNSPTGRTRPTRVTFEDDGNSQIASRPPTPVKVEMLQGCERPETPILPTPPLPKKILPPTPPKTGHVEAQMKHPGTSIDATLARARSTKALPTPPTHEFGRRSATPSPLSKPEPQELAATSPRPKPAAKQLALQMPQPKSTSPESILPSPQSSKPSISSRSEHRASRLEARLTAIERRNQLLEAALQAVLRTSGALNGCPCHLESPTSSSRTGSSIFTGHKAQSSVGSGTSISSSGRDVLDLFRETKVKY